MKITKFPSAAMHNLKGEFQSSSRRHTKADNRAGQKGATASLTDTTEEAKVRGRRPRSLLLLPPTHGTKKAKEDENRKTKAATLLGA